MTSKRIEKTRVKDLADPEEIREFLGTILDDLRQCNFNDVIGELSNAHVISDDQLRELLDHKNQNPGDLLYGYFTAKPSITKLSKLARIFQQDNLYDKNRAVGAKIEEFLEGPKGIEKMFSLETGEAAIKKAHRQFSLRNMVKAVCRIEAQPIINGNSLGVATGTCFFFEVNEIEYCITCIHCILKKEGMDTVGNSKKDILKALKGASFYVLDWEYTMSLQGPIPLIRYLKGDPDDLKEDILVIAEPELLAIECKTVPKEIIPFYVNTEAYRDIKVSAQSIVTTFNLPDKHDHTKQLQFSHGIMEHLEGNELTYYIDTCSWSSGSPVVLANTGPNLTTVTIDGESRSVARKGHCVIIGVHRGFDNGKAASLGMNIQPLLDNL